MLIAAYWAAKGAASSVDWCEPNYVVSQFIAEFWNTLSSIPIALAGLYGLYRLGGSKISGSKISARFTWSFLAVAIIGLGSVAFHGTLLKSAQALDELPMIYCSLTLVYALANRTEIGTPKSRRWAIGLTAYAVAFTVAYALLPQLFELFIVSYGLIVGGVVIVSARLSWGPTGTPTHKKLYYWAAGGYLSGVFFLWMPEHVFLACDHPAQAAHLHAWFHSTSVVGTYSWLLLLIWDHLTVNGHTPEFAPGVVPWIVPGAAASEDR
ncbi:MAG: dihydroceramidase [Myxococcota bacterium]|jgi:dihydroceramidase